MHVSVVSLETPDSSATWHGTVDKYEVLLKESDVWFDTGIPVVPEDRVDIEKPDYPPYANWKTRVGDVPFEPLAVDRD